METNDQKKNMNFQSEQTEPALSFATFTSAGSCLLVGFCVVMQNSRQRRASLPSSVGSSRALVTPNGGGVNGGHVNWQHMPPAAPQSNLAPFVAPGRTGGLNEHNASRMNRPPYPYQQGRPGASGGPPGIWGRPMLPPPGVAAPHDCFSSYFSSKMYICNNADSIPPNHPSMAHFHNMYASVLDISPWQSCDGGNGRKTLISTATYPDTSISPQLMVSGSVLVPPKGKNGSWIASGGNLGDYELTNEPVMVVLNPPRPAEDSPDLDPHAQARLRALEVLLSINKATRRAHASRYGPMFCGTDGHGLHWIVEPRSENKQFVVYIVPASNKVKLASVKFRCKFTVRQTNKHLQIYLPNCDTIQQSVETIVTKTVALPVSLLYPNSPPPPPSRHIADAAYHHESKASSLEIEAKPLSSESEKWYPETKRKQWTKAIPRCIIVQKLFAMKGHTVFDVLKEGGKVESSPMSYCLYHCAYKNPSAICFVRKGLHNYSPPFDPQNEAQQADAWNKSVLGFPVWKHRTQNHQRHLGTLPNLFKVEYGDVTAKELSELANKGVIKEIDDYCSRYLFHLSELLRAEEEVMEEEMSKYAMYSKNLFTDVVGNKERLTFVEPTKDKEGNCMGCIFARTQGHVNSERCAFHTYGPRGLHQLNDKGVVFDTILSMSQHEFLSLTFPVKGVGENRPLLSIFDVVHIRCECGDAVQDIAGVVMDVILKTDEVVIKLPSPCLAEMWWRGRPDVNKNSPLLPYFRLLLSGFMCNTANFEGWCLNFKSREIFVAQQEQQHQQHVFKDEKGKLSSLRSIIREDSANPHLAFLTPLFDLRFGLGMFKGIKFAMINMMSMMHSSSSLQKQGTVESNPLKGKYHRIMDKDFLTASEKKAIVRRVLAAIVCNENRPKKLPRPASAEPVKYFNADINREQRNACFDVVHNLHGSCPYLIWGPPGTGKTTTVVETMLQLTAKSAKGRPTLILACAPSDAACDVITQRLLKHLPQHRVCRVNHPQRKLASLPTSLLGVSQISVDGVFEIPNFQMDQYKSISVICCTTFVSSLLDFNISGWPHRKITHCFVDEWYAAAMQCIFFFSLILNSDDKTSLFLTKTNCTPSPPPHLRTIEKLV